MRFLVSFGLAAIVGASGMAQIPQIPKGADAVLHHLPTLDSLTKGTPPLTTDFEDTLGPVPLPRDLGGAKPGKLTDLPHTADGGFTLRPGVWEGTFESYCLAPATYGPGAGDGYLYAPLKGSREDVVASLLRGAGTHPEISQSRIQMLLWAVIARSKISDLPPDQRRVATELLTPEQIKKVNGDGLGLIPPSERSRLLGSLPASTRRSIEAEADLRDRLQRTSSSYEEIQRMAVLSGTPPPITGPHAVRGQWSRAPGGQYFVRYFPDGFSRTRVQVLVPEPTRVRYDRLNRVVSIEDARGNKTETEYDDAIPPMTLPQDRALKAYAFKLIRVTTVRASGPPEIHELRGKGWTFVQTTAPKRSVELVPAMFATPETSTASSMRGQETGGRFDHLRERYEQAQEIKERYDYYHERVDRLREHPDAQSVDRLGNLEHYRDGTRAAFGDLNDQLDWLREHQERENAALEYSTGVIDSLPGRPTDADGQPVVIDLPPQPPAPMYLPPTGTAVPSGRGRQRLGLSSRGG